MSDTIHIPILVYPAPGCLCSLCEEAREIVRAIGNRAMSEDQTIDKPKTRLEEVGMRCNITEVFSRLGVPHRAGGVGELSEYDAIKLLFEALFRRLDRIEKKLGDK